MELARAMERQTTLYEYVRLVRYLYVPITRQYASRYRLSERLLRQRLEKQGWEVWRGGLIGIENRSNIYPNVQKRYKQLTELLRKKQSRKLVLLRYFANVQHGMPDFICYKDGKFKFVECKFGYESLSKRQKRCIPRLLDLGFEVEVHKVVEGCTKMRWARVNVVTGQKNTLERQTRLNKKCIEGRKCEYR